MCVFNQLGPYLDLKMGTVMLSTHPKHDIISMSIEWRICSKSLGRARMFYCTSP